MLGQQIANGLIIGLVYGVLALGFSLAYSTTRVVNFAHGEMFTLGTFVALTLQRTASQAFLVAGVAAVVLLFLIGAAFAQVVLSRLPTPLGRAVATIALSLGLRDGMLLVFGSDSASFLPVFPEGAFDVAGVAVPRASLVVVPGVGLLLALFTLYSARAKWGLWMRAAAQDEVLAKAVGIPVPRVRAAAFGIAAALAAAAGVLIGPLWQVNYAAGSLVAVKAFTAAMIGGLGNLSGAILGGLVLGVGEALLAGYVTTVWKDVAIYACLLAVIVLAPRGLLATAVRRLS